MGTDPVLNPDKRSRSVGAVVIRSGDRALTLNMTWGLRPPAGSDRPILMLRSEGRRPGADERCLIIATELPLTGPDNRKWLVSLNDGQPYFCFAGIWRPATADWPQAYAALTVAAAPDIAPIKDRHLAFVRKKDWTDWLGGAPVEEILRPFPKGSFKVKPVGRSGAIGDLFEFGQ